MTRADLLQHLMRFNCELLREGGNHTIYINPANTKTASVPRHNEIAKGTVVKICKTLEISSPFKPSTG